VVRKYSIRLLINVMPMASQRGKSEGRQVVPVTVVVGSAVMSRLDQNASAISEKEKDGQI
jgi:hypothetical protein